MADASWYRLDNVGKFYAAQAGSPNQTIFRLAATMADEVDEQALQRALDATVAQFPGFNVSLRSGMFWHYLEPSGTSPRVTPENLPICYGLHAGPQSVLFRVSYYRRRINVEVSHMISDGRGALEFLKALLGAYVAERYGLPEAAACALCGHRGAEDRGQLHDQLRPLRGGKGEKAARLPSDGPEDRRRPALPGIPPIGQRRACRRQRRRSQRHLLPHRGGHLRRARQMTARDRDGPSTWTSPSTCAPLRLGHPAQLLRARLYHLHPRRCQCAAGCSGRRGAAPADHRMRARLPEAPHDAMIKLEKNPTSARGAPVS